MEKETRVTEGLSGLLTNLTKGGGGNLLQSLLKVAGSQSGGIGGLLSKFTDHDDPVVAGKAQSWVSTGENQTLSGDEVEQAVGSDTVEQVATDAGVSPDQARHGMAAMLPQLFDKLSPDGKMPDMGTLGKLLGH